MVDRDDHDTRSRRDGGEMMPVTIYISMALMEEVNRLTRAQGTNAGIVIKPSQDLSGLPQRR